jgi:general secretion pathway protein D
MTAGALSTISGHIRSCSRFALAALALALAGCNGWPIQPAPPITGPAGQARPPVPIAEQEPPKAGQTKISPGRVAGAPAEAPPGGGGQPPKGPPIEISVENVPLVAFINTVFGESLKVPFEVDPKVAQRGDVVTLRTGGQKPPEEVLSIARQVLASYGVEVIQADNLYRIVPSDALLAQTPRLLRVRSQSDVPADLRPVFQYVEIKRVKMPELKGWITEAYGQKLRMIQLNDFNAILMLGLPEDVRAGLEAVRMLDQPRLAGQRSLRIEPVYWAVDKLAAKLLDVLKIEGYSAGVGSAAVSAVNLLPIEQVNALLVFAPEQATLNHVADWVRDLDKPSEADPLKRLFFYQVKNTDAATVAQVVAQVVEGLLPGGNGGGGGGVQSTPVAATPPTAGVGSVTAPPPQQSQTVLNSRRLVVDATRNAIIFQGTAEEFSQVRQLLDTLDQPTREALIEVTVAEVTLDANTQFGVEWAITTAGLNGDNIKLGTLGGLGLGTAGFNLAILSAAGQTKAVLNALATNNRAQVLSSPRLVARSGGEARIQVGNEVPLITSQTTSPQQVSGTTGVLQTIQYRSTGVLLTIKPIIHGSRRVDLDISQEVSDAQQNQTSNLSTPVISNRKVTTQLSLADGATVIIGGLIRNSTTQGNTGVPGLKDIPVLGQLFRVDSDVHNRTELIILITPYVITNDNEAETVTDTFRRKVGDWFQPE